MSRKERDGEIRKVFGVVEIQFKQVWKLLIQQKRVTKFIKATQIQISKCRRETRRVFPIKSVRNTALMSRVLWMFCNRIKFLASVGVKPRVG